MPNITDHTTVKTLLAVDGATCAIMGLGLLLAAGPVAALTEIPAPLLFWAGALLVPIAAFMALSARATPVPAWAAGIVVLGNVLWSAASVLLPLTGAVTPNPLGWALILGQAAVVAVLAWLEYGAMRQPALAA